MRYKLVIQALRESSDNNVQAFVKDIENMKRLTAEERQWLDDYHQMVFDRLSPLLDEEECRWLRQATRPIV